MLDLAFDLQDTSRWAARSDQELDGMIARSCIN